MNFLALIPCFSCVAYLVLIAQTLREAKKPANKIFTAYIVASMAWNLFTLSMWLSPSIPSGLLTLFSNLVIVTTLLSFVVYYHLIRAYSNQPAGIVTYGGYACILIAAGLSFGGYVVKDAAYTSTGFQIDSSIWAFSLIAIILLFATLPILSFIKKYRTSKDHSERNKNAYLIIGLGIAAASGLSTFVFLATGNMPVGYIGNLVNAWIISFIIRGHKLIDLGLLYRRALAYGFLAIPAAGIYAGCLLLEIKFISWIPLTADLIAISCVSAILLILIVRLRPKIEQKIDRIFDSDSCEQRRVLAEFSSKFTNTLDLDSAANEMITTLGKALKLTRAELLLKNNDDFITQYTYPKAKNGDAETAKFKLDNGIADWLVREDKPLKAADMPNIPEIYHILAEDKEGLLMRNLTSLLPVKGREKMIGVLALSSHHNGDNLRTEELEIAAAIARQAGVVIENAQLYAQAQQRANINELTGLFNHRHFHERVTEEVTRSSRFGDVFSLLMIDLDCFKSYNDIYGHLHGDSILKKVGEIIRGNIRAIDIAARYGGDEFSVILPKASIDSAMSIAERLRSAMESEFNNEGMSITCSIGAASWPTDGIMKEDLIHAADSALYYAKKSGRNRVFTASKLATLNKPEKATREESNSLILDTVYALAATVDAKDHYTFGHSKKVSKYACDIAIELGYSEEKVNIVRTAGLLHDIGKIGVSDEILGKNSSLNDNEWKPIHAHPTMGVSILMHVDSIKECLPGVLYHHEHFDGSGYPQGLKGENIPLDARIIAVADSYDAMTSCRPYRNNSWSTGRAVEELIRYSGTQFDPKVVQVFVKMLSKTPHKNATFAYTHTNA